MTEYGTPVAATKQVASVVEKADRPNPRQQLLADAQVAGYPEVRLESRIDRGDRFTFEGRDYWWFVVAVCGRKTLRELRAALEVTA